MPKNPAPFAGFGVGAVGEVAAEAGVVAPCEVRR
jgi:hypothetical protein